MSNNTVKGEVTVTFEFASANVFDHAKKKEFMKKIGRLPMDDIERLEQIIESPKALKALKDKWLMLKAMFR